MKKFLKVIGFTILFIAAGNIVLHGVRLDDSHLKDGGHDCGLCQTLSTSNTTPAVVLTQTFISFDLVLPHHNAHYSSILTFLKDNRGPPLV